MNVTAVLLWMLAASTLLPAQQWRLTGVGGGGALFLPSFSPHDGNELFIASDMSALFHSTDFGTSWGQVHFSEIQVSGTLGLVQFTSDPSILYAISRPGDDTPRPVKSTDGGATWFDLPSDPVPYSLFVDPAGTNRILLSDFSKLYISTDGGKEFQEILEHDPNRNGIHIAGVFFDGDTIYIGTNAGLLISIDGGASFSPPQIWGIPADESMVSMAGARVGDTTRLFCVTLDEDRVEAGVTGADFGYFMGLYTCNVGAGNWISRGKKIPEGVSPFFVGMARNNIDVAYIAGGSDDEVPMVYKTADGGATWSSVLRTEENNNIITGWSGAGGDREWSYGEYALGLAVAPNDPNRVAITDLGFPHLTSDGGTSWRQGYVAAADQNPAGERTPQRKRYRGNGMENTSCWQVFWADSSTMIAAFSDIRGIISRDAGTTWSFDYTGHTMNSMYRIVSDPTSGTLYAATSSVHDIYQSTYLQDNRLQGNGEVLFSKDKGRTWELLHFFRGPVTWVALDPNRPNRIYASVTGTFEPGIHLSDDIDRGGESTWRKLAAPPRTEGHPFNIEVLNDGTLLCTYSGRRADTFTYSSGVFISTDGGASWLDRSAPQMLYWTKDVVIDPHDPAQNTWYVGVFKPWGNIFRNVGGLYRTTDRGLTWTQILDISRVTSCTINPEKPGEMYVTTETEGLWYSKDANAPTPSFSNIASYPFRQPERVFFNPYKPGEIWVTSFGNGMRAAMVETSGVDGRPEVVKVMRLW